MTDLSGLGIIGNCRSAALINNEGSIVWCCMPDFDSPSVFAKILDEDKGGEMQIGCENVKSTGQYYIDRTNILVTHYKSDEGSFDLIDFMPVYPVEENSYYQSPEIYRLLRLVSGKPAVKVLYKPALNYALSETKSFIQENYIKSITTEGDYHSIYLYSNLSYQDIIGQKSFVLENDVFFLLSYHQKIVPVDKDWVHLELNRTKVYWMNWISRTKNYKKYNNQIVRSALTLKLLTYQKTGAVIAAVTTSIPESIGDNRNWDYRYCWLRDASMIIKTLVDIHHKNTARAFLRFLLKTMIRKADTLQILYGIRAEKELTEMTLDHLKGYKGSKPVRIGNAAYIQKQNDVYGVLMDLIYSSFLYFPASISESEELWTTVRFIMKTVEDNWRNPDMGIWEIRSVKKHFTFSKILSWVAADRGVKVAQMLERHDYIASWIKIREAIRNDIEKNGWNEKKKAYTQVYGGSDLDASLLLIEKVGYCRADDRRFISTVKAVYEELCVDGLVYRYRNDDDFGKPKSAFIICTFWMIDGIYKTGDKKLAVKMFEDLIACSNNLGLLSEDMDFKTRELLGNFPQGYSHLALINTAVLLNGDDVRDTVFNYIRQ